MQGSPANGQNNNKEHYEREIKQLQDELSKQKSLNRNREQLLQELDEKSKQLYDQEAKLKLTQNELAHAAT